MDGLGQKLSVVRGSEVFGFGIRSVGGVVDDTDIKRGGVEINNSVFGGNLIVSRLGNGGKIRAGFHFDNGEVAFGIFVD